MWDGVSPGPTTNELPSCFTAPFPLATVWAAQELGTEGFIPAWSPLELDEKVSKVSHKGEGRPLNIRGRTEVEVCWGSEGPNQPTQWNPSSPGEGGTERGFNQQEITEKIILSIVTGPSRGPQYEGGLNYTFFRTRKRGATHFLVIEDWHGCEQGGAATDHQNHHGPHH